MILVTGSSGLIGRRFAELCGQAGIAVRGFDIRRDSAEDIRDPSAVGPAAARVEGVVHLAAISRVVWAQRRPDLAHSVNVEGTRTLLDVLARSPAKPWIVFASSREIYGDARSLPVAEDAEQHPMNAYARSKVDGERLIARARAEGMTANVCRFSNVYGSIDDHADRVAVAFARAAAFGGELRVEGGDNVFDFTHVDDAAAGLLALVAATRRNARLPPVQFVSGEATRLSDLADLAGRNAAPGQPILRRERPARRFDVTRFVGDPRRAEALLGWRAGTPLAPGFGRFVDALRRHGTPIPPLPWLDAIAAGDARERADGPAC